jgi:hypothetical protein
MQLESLIIPIKAQMDKNLLLGAAAGITALVGLATLAVKATEKWAMELDSIQDILGVTSKDAAAFNFVLRKSSTDTNTFTKSMTFLEKGLVKSDGQLDTVGKSLKAYGINVKDANGKVKDQTTLIKEISDKYNSFSTQQERVNFLTEVFGKSGANLVDFFDTLAKEGGLDKVTEKVKQFGLAIDPQRYEDFNRNLEELRLIALGLAVGFTEKLMPVLEGFLNWVMTEGIPGAKKFWENLKAGKVDWKAISDDLIAGLDDIDWSGLGTKVHDKAVEVWGGIKKAADEIDWAGITASFLGGMAEFLASAVTGKKMSVDNIVPDLHAAEVQVDLFWSTLGDRWHNWLVTEWARFDNDWNASMGVWKNNWVQLRTIAVAEYIKLQPTIIATTIGLVGEIILNLDTIKKAFFNAFQGAMQQAVSAIAGMRTRVINEVTNFINDVKRIIGSGISFGISVSLPNFVALAAELAAGMALLRGAGGAGGVGGRIDTSARSGGGGLVTPAPAQQRASGGPVIAGQAYSMNEFGKTGEVFVPNKNGRVETKKPQKVTVDIDYNALARAIAIESVKAWNNV